MSEQTPIPARSTGERLSDAEWHLKRWSKNAAAARQVLTMPPWQRFAASSTVTAISLAALVTSIVFWIRTADVDSADAAVLGTFVSGVVLFCAALAVLEHIRDARGDAAKEYIRALRAVARKKAWVEKLRSKVEREKEADIAERSRSAAFTYSDAAL